MTPAEFAPVLSLCDTRLSSVGFRLAEERYSHASFGSVLAEFSRRGCDVQIVWDGKERALFARYRQHATGEWTDVEQGLPLQQGLDSDRIHALLDRLDGALQAA